MEDLSSAAPAADVTPVAVDTTPAPETAAPEAPQETTEADLDSELAKVFKRATREPSLRAEDGKFASKNPPAPAEPDAKSVDQPQEAAKTEAQEKPAPIGETPLSWSAEMKAKFATLPPEVQSYVVQRDKEAHEHISRLGNAVKQIEPIGRLLEEHRETFASKRMTYSQGLDQLLRAQKALDTDPVSAISKLATAYGVDLASYGSHDGANPQSAVLLQQVRDLTQEINALKGTVGARERSEANQRQQSLEAAVTKFSEGKTDFEELADDIVAHVTALRATNPNLSHEQLLEKAYDAARWANPKSRERIMSEQAKAAEAKRLEEARKQAEAAKNASRVNVKSQAKANAVTDDLDATLATVWRKQNAA